jgi:hypothetical protein
MPDMEQFRLDQLKQDVESRDCNCLWCRKTIPSGTVHYKRKRTKGDYYRYHITCVEGAIERGQFDGLMGKEWGR